MHPRNHPADSRPASRRGTRPLIPLTSTVEINRRLRGIAQLLSISPERGLKAGAKRTSEEEMERVHPLPNDHSSFLTLDPGMKEYRQREKGGILAERKEGNTLGGEEQGMVGKREKGEEEEEAEGRG